MKEGEGEGKEGNASAPPLFYLRHFCAVFDSCFSFLASKPRRNACYAGYSLDQTFNGIYRDSTNFPLTGTVFRFLSEFE